MRAVPSPPAVVARRLPSGDQATALHVDAVTGQHADRARRLGGQPALHRQIRPRQKGARRRRLHLGGRDGSASSQASIVVATRARRASGPGRPPSRWACRASHARHQATSAIVGHDAGGHSQVRLACVRAVPRDPSRLVGRVGDRGDERVAVAGPGEVRSQVLPHVRLVRAAASTTGPARRGDRGRRRGVARAARAGRRRAGAGTRGRGRGSRSCRVAPRCSTSAAIKRSRSAAVSSALRPRVCAQYRAIAATGTAVSGGKTASPSSAARRSAGSAATAMCSARKVVAYGWVP